MLQQENGSGGDGVVFDPSRVSSAQIQQSMGIDVVKFVHHYKQILPLKRTLTVAKMVSFMSNTYNTRKINKHSKKKKNLKGQ